jgi:uncharacterized protein (DUF3820 family)
MNDDEPILPFGKHKGEHLSEVPVEYLDWLIGQDWLRPALKKQIEAHLLTRPEWQRLGDD